MAQYSGEVEVAVVDDLAVESDDEDLLGTDIEDGCLVLVGVGFCDGDVLAEQVDVAVGAEDADDLDAASLGSR